MKNSQEFIGLSALCQIPVYVLSPEYDGNNESCQVSRKENCNK